MNQVDIFCCIFLPPSCKCLHCVFNFFYYHLDGTLEVPYNLSPTRFIKSWNIIIKGLCVYAFELVFGPLSFYKVYNSWSIINGLCVYAFEFVCTPLSLSKVYSSWSIMNGLCVYAFELENTQLNLFKVYSSWNIMNGLCVYAFECVYTQMKLCGVQAVS
jgi:hypothetical protein